MANTLHALFVGIDDYPSGDGLDHSCERADALYSFVSGRLSAGWTPKIQPVLKNRQATRQNIINKLKLLQNATRGDVCLFYFAGHGSNEPRDHRIKHIITEDKLETILCVDSRAGGALDLADKELAYLIHQVVKNGAHFVAIMDCCNSGDNTREDESDLKISTAAPNLQARALKDFYGYEQSKPNYPVVAKHVQLAACTEDGSAYDGLFTKTLLEVINNERIGNRYRDIIPAVKDIITPRRPKQVPNLGKSDEQLHSLPFLNGAIRLT